MKWERIAVRHREHAHKLRTAFAGALELRLGTKWDRAEVEAAGLRDYARVFGRSISAGYFWRLLDSVVTRDAGKREFSKLDLYLPEVIKAQPKAAKSGADLPDLEAALHAVGSCVAPTPAETQLIWDAACNEFSQLTATGRSACKAKKIILNALAGSGVTLARTYPALRKSFSTKLARWEQGGRRISALKDLRSEKSGNHRALPLSVEDQNNLKWRALSGGLAQAWRAALSEGELSATAAARFISNPSSKSYVPQRVRDLITPDVNMMQDIHHGPRQAALKGAYITRDWSAVSPGDWYSADDTTLPLYYWQEDADGTPRVMRGQCLFMNDCRTNRILSFVLHSERNYTARVIRGLILKTHDTYGLPREGFFFERGIWANAKLLKGAKDEVPSDETELGLREWVKFKHAKPGNARAKTIERIIGLIQNRIEDQPGYCGRNEQIEKFERLQRALLDVNSGNKHPKDFLMHRDEWTGRLAQICDDYNCEAQDGRMLAGLSPREAWDSMFDSSRPLVRLSFETRYLLANHRRPLKVTRNGVCVQIGNERTWFRNEYTGQLIGRIVQVYFDPEDLSSIYLQRELGDSTAAVIPAAPIIPAMVATREQISAAQSSVTAQNRAARTMYQEIKPHFAKNAPAMFRQVVADGATIELGRDIAADKSAIRDAQSAQHSSDRKLSNLRRRFGATRTQGTVSPEAQLAAYKLLEEANSDAD
ncbi:MAG: Mu transposase C-terminal domain-containing protein [Opitutus sp.]